MTMVFQLEIVENDVELGKKLLLPLHHFESSFYLTQFSWNRLRTAPSVASAVLCILIPNLHSSLITLPTKVASSDGESLERVRLIYQPLLWDFLRLNLKSSDDIGANYGGMKGGVGFGNNSRGRNIDLSSPYDNDGEMEDSDVESLTRRRSIHMLKLIIDKEYEVNKVLQKSADGENAWSRILVWKKFILCFESLEMEVSCMFFFF